MENLTFFILGASLTSLCFLIYLKARKSRRRSRTISGYKLPYVGGKHYQ